MKKAFLLAIIAVVFRCCLLAQTPDQLSIQKLMDNFNAAAEKEDAKGYGSLFGPSAVWDGPLGENAIGPANIEQSADLMFSSFGPLETLTWVGRPLASNVELVDVYQRMKARPKDLPSAPKIAPGSIGPPHRSALRTTLIFQKQDDQWRIVAARLADLRIRNTQPITTSSLNSRP